MGWLQYSAIPRGDAQPDLDASRSGAVTHRPVAVIGTGFRIIQSGAAGDPARACQPQVSLLNFLAGVGTGSTICGETQTLLRCLIGDFQDAGVVLHPTLRRVGNKSPLLLGCLQHES
jgi:hypothetical protein